MSTEDKVADAIGELSKEVYKDLAKPSISEIGKTSGGLTRMCLGPLNAIVWGYDKIVEMLEYKLSKKLNLIPSENLQTPSAFIAVPALEALRYSSEIEELRDLYINLLANTMDSRTSANVHPSFVDILKNISSDEAKILKIFLVDNQVPYINVIRKESKLERSFVTVIKTHIHVLEDYDVEISDNSKLPMYFDNLVRIGLLESPEGFSLESSNYVGLESCEFIGQVKSSIEEQGKFFETQRKFFGITSFGSQFVDLVVKDS